jgi:hypothetical protein
MKHDRDYETSVIFVLFEGVPIGSRREDEHLLLIDYE